MQRQYDRGKVMTAEELEAGKDFGRYKDVDGDGIPWRTCPAPTRPRAATSPGAPRATRMRSTPSAGPDYIYNVERLLKKFKSAADLVPQPVFRHARTKTPWAWSISAPPARPCVKRWTCSTELRASTWTPCACRRFPFPASGGAVSGRPRQRCLWWSKTATRRCIACW
jgi:2-oxoglutarate ferredoxin oxidoreductase subunit alpha